MTLYKVTVNETCSNMRADKAAHLLLDDENISRSQIQKAIKDNQFKLNDVIINNLSVKVKLNDILEFTLIEAIAQHIVPTEIELDIVYEDEDIIVLNKPYGLTTHPGAGNHQDTLANALLYHSNNLSDIGGMSRPGIVHRLDKDTSGLMVVAKNNQAHFNLAKQLAARTLGRKYLAIVWGKPKENSGIIDVNIDRCKINRKKMTTAKSLGKSAITYYNIIDVFCGGSISLVECKLETGRTHQIRVHMSHIGHSLIGDQTYGNNGRKVNHFTKNLNAEVAECILNFKRQALHSCYIEFEHPNFDKMMKFEVPPPKDFNNLLNLLKKAKLS